MYGDRAKQLIAELPNRGRLDNPTCHARAGNPVCGDEVELFLEIENGIIRRFRYLVSGCGGSMAGVAVLSLMVLDQPAEDALNMTTNRLYEYLGGVPEAKRHGLELALDALRLALATYEPKS